MAPFTIMDIKLLCGVTAFKRGEEYQQSGRIGKLTVSEDGRHYRAVVRGTETYEVKVDLDDAGEIEAHCDCPAYGNYYDYCKHIAAVLLAIHERADTPEPPSSKGTPSKVGTLVEEETWERPYTASPSTSLSTSESDSTSASTSELSASSLSSSLKSSSDRSTVSSGREDMHLQNQHGQLPVQASALQRLHGLSRKSRGNSRRRYHRHPLPRRVVQALLQAGGVLRINRPTVQQTRFCPCLPKSADCRMNGSKNIRHQSLVPCCVRSFRFSSSASWCTFLAEEPSLRLN